MKLNNTISLSGVRGTTASKTANQAYDIFASANKKRYAADLEKHKKHEELMAKHAKHRENKSKTS